MNNTFSIRTYQEGDFDQVLHIFKTNVPNYFSAEELYDLKEYIKDEIEDYYLVLKNDEVIGAGGINYDSDQITARLSWDFMDQSLHLSGAGTALTQYRIQHIKKINHIKRLIVRTSQFADGFYAKQGFTEIERIQNYWAEGFDMVMMEYKGLRAEE